MCHGAVLGCPSVTSVYCVETAKRVLKLSRHLMLCLSDYYSPCGASLFYIIDKNIVGVCIRNKTFLKSAKSHTNQSGRFKDVTNQTMLSFSTFSTYW